MYKLRSTTNIGNVTLLSKKLLCWSFCSGLRDDERTNSTAAAFAFFQVSGEDTQQLDAGTNYIPVLVAVQLLCSPPHAVNKMLSLSCFPPHWSNPVRHTSLQSQLVYYQIIVSKALLSSALFKEIV